MKCKFCDAEFEEELEVCPTCGKSLIEEKPAQETVEETAEYVEETAEEVVTEETVEDGEETAEGDAVEEKPKKKIWKWVVAIAGAVIVLAGVAVALLFALGIIKTTPNDVKKLDVYTVSDEKMLEVADEVIAKIGDKTLTNAELQIYYKMQVQEFLSYYGSYLSSIGLDYTKPLSEQACYLDEELTWEQYFIDTAIQTWQNYQTMVLLAEEKGFTLTEEQQAELDKFEETMQAQAEEGGYKTAEEMIEDVLGAGCTVEDYKKYVVLVLTSNEFYSQEYTRLTPTDEEIEAYFNENKETFETNGITKDGGLISSVRHILISPEGGTKNEETGETTYSKKEWNAAKKKAEKVHKEWKDGKATEASFGELANKYSADGGSNTTGGLYEDITPVSSYVETFRAWAVDSSRKTGDTGIVETEYGYHIMYFVSGEPYWLQEAGTMLLSERTTAMIDEAIEKWPMEVTYKKIVLTDLELE